METNKLSVTGINGKLWLKNCFFNTSYNFFGKVISTILKVKKLIEFIKASQTNGVLD